MKLVRSLCTIGLSTTLVSAFASGPIATGTCPVHLARMSASAVSQQEPEASIPLGFSLSPGGLLLPYHLGVLDALQYNKFIDETTPIAGSSAGAIATASHGCGIDSRKVLEATIDISDRTKEMGGARGRLLPLLKEKLFNFIGNEEWERLLDRDGEVGIAYREIFPTQRNILQTSFEDRKDLIDAVCHSSMFPFFATNLPFSFSRRKGDLLPRLYCDGFFTVPRERFGCPDFEHAGVNVARTIMVSVFPKDTIGLDASHPDDCISPEVKDGEEMPMRLLKLATESSSRKELTEVYESGWIDAERWCRAQMSNANKKMEAIV